MNEQFKIDVNKNCCRANNAEVVRIIKNMWENNVPTNAIANSLNISSSSVFDITKTWPRLNKRWPYVFPAYCLIVEHGLSIEEAALILEIKAKNLKLNLIKREKQIMDHYEEWKEYHTRWRKSLR